MAWKVLWITPRWPEPANDGAKIATIELLKHLAPLPDLELTLLALPPPNDDTPELPDLKLFETRIIARKPEIRSRLSRFATNPFIPVSFSSFLQKETVEEVRAFAAQDRWDAVIFDGIHAAIPFFSPGLSPSLSFPAKSAKLFYRAHNVEWSLWEQAAKQSPFPKSQALALQAHLVKKYEVDLIQKCTETFPVSDEDLKRFAHITPEPDQQVILIGKNFEKQPSPTNVSSTIHLGFIGRIDWLPNREGLAWFLKEVWPEVVQKKPDLEFSIAGSGDDSWLAPFRNLPRVKFLGKIPSVDPFYHGLDALIVPLFMGSGTRVKVIEASQFARVCLSTALGVEGCGLIEGKSVLLAETKSEWVDLLMKLDSESLRTLGQEAFTSLRKKHDSALIATKLHQALISKVSK